MVRRRRVRWGRSRQPAAVLSPAVCTCESSQRSGHKPGPEQEGLMGPRQPRPWLS